mgnify:CR=1 FL=1
MNIQLNDGRVLVKTQKEAEKTSGGLYIPGNVNRDETSVIGEVVNAGQTRSDAAGRPTSIDFAKGDRVLLSPLGVTKVKVNGEEMLLVRHEDIIAKLFDTVVDRVHSAPTAVGRIEQ